MWSVGCQKFFSTEFVPGGGRRTNLFFLHQIAALVVGIAVVIDAGELLLVAAHMLAHHLVEVVVLVGILFALKATQGDTGHAQASMVTEVYAHILDEERKINAQKFEVAFYANPDMRRVEQELNPPKPEPAPDLNLQSLLAQLQENPELARQLKALLHAG